MNITRTSMISSKVQTLDLPVTEQQMQSYLTAHCCRMPFPISHRRNASSSKPALRPTNGRAKSLMRIDALPRCHNRQ